MRDFRHALRSLLQQPLFSAIVILTFALGIGANTAIFSVLNAVLLRPLPYHEPQNLVAVGGYDLHAPTHNDTDLNSISYPNFVDWKAQNHVFEDLAVYSNHSMTLTDGREATHLQGEIVSAGLFPILGIQPILGRTFSSGEDEPGQRVVILSHGLWQRRYGGDPNIVGKLLTLDGEKFQVIGVMPAGFAFPIDAFGPEIWTSLATLRETRDGGKPMTEERGNDFLRCIGRLKPNVSARQAQANMESIGAALRQQYPDTNTGWGVMVLPLLRSMIAGAHSALMMLCAMAGCVLLVACANVANLLLARSVSRHKEISIRAALGAGRWHIVKQLLSESILLGLCGGLAGLAIAIWGLDALKAFLPANIPRVDQISPDHRVLIFTTFVSLAVGALAGLVPAWRASHPNLVAALNETSRGSTEGAGGRTTRSALVVVEIVLALVLLASAGLLIESFLRLQRVNPGFDPGNVLTARVALPDAAYPRPERVADFTKKFLARLSNVPGVESAGAAWWIPLSGSEITFTFDIQERPLPKAQQPAAQMNAVTYDYFRTLRTPITRGRDFTVQDDRNAPKVIIVTESFAREFFPGEDPIGKRLAPGASDQPGDPPVREIVGVVPDIHLISLRDLPKPQVYIPHAQLAIPSFSVFVRSKADSRSLIGALHEAANEIDPDVPIYRVRPLTDYFSQSIAQPRLNATLVGLFALIALLLAAAGIFGVMSYSVTQRTQEIGIRFALGAQRGDVLRLIVGHGIRLIAVGVALGFMGVLALTRLLQSLLFGVGAADLPVMMTVAAILAIVALAACWLPAMRASQVDPMTALRAE